MTPEQQAADRIARAVEKGTGYPMEMSAPIARAAVEAISAAELLIVPAGRMAALLEVARAARALAESEPNMWALLHGSPEEAAAVPDDWPEADALLVALVEVAA